MDQSTQVEPARIDDLLVAYRDLQSEFDRALARLRRADEQKHTVQRRIYDRVRAEYDRELDAIRARMSPLRDEIDRVHESLEAQCRDANSVVQTVEDELAEVEFRNRIGEYDGSAFDDVRRSLDARAEEARVRHALLKTTLDAIAAMRRPDAQAAPASAATDDPAETGSNTPETAAAPASDAPATSPADAPVTSVAEATPASGTTKLTVEDLVPRRPVLSAEKIVPAGPADGFENPHDWISEMGPESARAQRRARVTVPAPAPTPAKPPAKSAADELDAALTPVSTPTTAYPSLVFVSGPHAGQAIALLPTTLTIGREHDNNIELKDAEVARYHARILRERGEYVVEDLSSSTGTWVNGERTQRCVLTHGDVIRMGQTELALDFEWTTDSR